MRSIRGSIVWNTRETCNINGFREKRKKECQKRKKEKSKKAKKQKIRELKIKGKRKEREKGVTVERHNHRKRQIYSEPERRAGDKLKVEWDKKKRKIKEK